MKTNQQNGMQHGAKFKPSLWFACAILAAAIFPTGAHAQTDYPFNASADTYEPGFFPDGSGAWTSGDLQIPGGTTMSSTPVEFDITLSHDLTIDNTGPNGEYYGFGMAGFSPEVPPGGDCFNFAIELLENGTLLTQSFATIFANPYTYMGFDETNPFAFDVSDISTGDNTTGLNQSITFNQVDIQVLNSNQGGQGVTDFTVDLGVVPEPSTWVLLTAAAAASLLACRLRKPSQ